MILHDCAQIVEKVVAGRDAVEMEKEKFFSQNGVNRTKEMEK